jgi:hypothetical protein
MSQRSIKSRQATLRKIATTKNSDDDDEEEPEAPMVRKASASPGTALVRNPTMTTYDTEF